MFRPARLLFVAVLAVLGYALFFAVPADARAGALFVFGVPLAVAYLVTNWIHKKSDRPRTVGQIVFLIFLFLFISWALFTFIMLLLVWGGAPPRGGL